MAGPQLGAPCQVNTIRGSLAPALSTVRAALFERERSLFEKLRFMSEASYRDRVNVESELSDIRRKLERLAVQTRRNGARSPDRNRPEYRKDSIAKGAALPNVTRVPPPDTKKKKEAPRRSRLGRLYDRLVSTCVVETTAATQSGMSSWKTEPCRVLLHLLAKPTLSAQGPGSARWSTRAYVALVRVFF
jgi:hypothetical protein